MIYKINSCDYNIKSFIKNIVVNEFGIDYWDDWLDKQDYDSLHILPNVLFSAEENNELIGICSIKKINDDECYLNSFYVMKKYRNHGIGKELFNKCIEYAKNNSYKKILLSVDPHFKTAIKIYEKKFYF